MTQIRCISTTGGCQNGMYANGNPVPWFADAARAPDPATLRLPPNPGGYIHVAPLGLHVAVGSVIDVTDEMAAALCVPDGHFEYAQDAPGATQDAAAAQDVSAPADGSVLQPASATAPPDPAGG